MTVTSKNDDLNSSHSNSNLSVDKDVFETIIIGAGFSGIGMAINLKKFKQDDFIIFERNSGIGGTWWANTYPGCACDVPSNVYSFSFEPNSTWSKTFSPQDEIQQYLYQCAVKYSIIDKIRINTEVISAVWDDHMANWVIRTNFNKTYYSRFLIAASGALSEPTIPNIKGLNKFNGQYFHSAKWNHDINLKNKKVAIVGTGASAIQFAPEIADDTKELRVFMRTAPWILPRRDRKVTYLEQIIFKKVPALQLLVRAVVFWARESYLLAFTKNKRLMKIAEKLAKRHLNSQIKNDDVKSALLPNYEMGCKRILLSNNFYSIFNRENVKLVTSGIKEFNETKIVCEDGEQFDADVVIFGTGFNVVEMPVAKYIMGTDGSSLSELWQGSPRALYGTTIQNFPNLFLLMGPNTGLGHNSMVYMIESQINYVIQAMKELTKIHKTYLVPKAEAVRRFTDSMDSQSQNTVWVSGCVSWYLDKQGRNPTLWPDFSWKFRSQTRNINTKDYIFK